MGDLSDEGVPRAIRDFVRNNADIEVTQHLVRGYNGEVYFGKRKKLGDEVVLKFYDADANYNETEEAVILKTIKHRNILEIFDLRYIEPGYSLFLTPKISGGDLQEIINNRRLSSKESLEFIDGILQGVNDLHATHGLVHRDLKPENILIDLDTKCPIIADLGAVKKVDGVNSFVSASKATYLYLPPEAVSKNEYYFQSDIYQIGVVMFQLLGGSFPVNDPYKWLTDKENVQIAAIRNLRDRSIRFDNIIGSKIKKGQLIDIKSLPYYLDDGFKRVINKAIHLDRTKRFSNAAHFLKEVHTLLRNCPEYLADGDRLFINHENGRSFLLYQNNKREIVLEKSVSGKDWRKDNGHKGDLNMALSIARNKV